ncbi:MAG: hypothetical protein HYR56_16435 [Acidobacteria bacterium]|nr:hypothetical protein [Acidobacteriota bacterium]MBI3421402.1 hypothetical protein [Acidobacteriota bacterium]
MAGSSACIAALEDVLDWNAVPYDPERPKVHFDGTHKQRLKETRAPLPPQTGQVAKDAYA